MDFTNIFILKTCIKSSCGLINICFNPYIFTNNFWFPKRRKCLFRLLRVVLEVWLVEKIKEQNIRMWKATISSCTKNKGNVALLIVAQLDFWFGETMKERSKLHKKKMG